MEPLAPAGQRSGMLTSGPAWAVSQCKGGPARAWCAYPEALSRSLGWGDALDSNLLTEYRGFPRSRLGTELAPEGLDSSVLN